MPNVTAVDIGLFLLLIIVLLGPFMWKVIEHNLEAFLFVMGVIAATIAWVWSPSLILDAIVQPIVQGIVPAVLVAGIAFHYGRGALARGMRHVQKGMSIKAWVFIIVAGLGLLSSLVSAIIATLLLVELVHYIPLDRRNRIELVVVSCFSIGFGAVLTPLGEPLSVIVVTSLRGAPYYADFFFLMRNFGIYVLPGIVFFGILGMSIVEGKRTGLMRIFSLSEDEAKELKVKCPRCGALAVHDASKKVMRCPKCAKEIKHLHISGQQEEIRKDGPETVKDALVRVLKVYLFVIALIFLGKGMSPLVVKYFTLFPAMGLYWLNMLSAVLDNATLAAAEVGPALTLVQIKSAVMGMLAAGGMLLPGNIPNIIAANKLKIKSMEWARVGVPLGLGVMLFYFVWLFFIPFP